jgi:hypothetical protein
MDGPRAVRRSSFMGPAVWISIVLVLGATAPLAWAAMAFQPQDIEAIESPLVLVVARQIESGPRGLYGPYDGRYPLVLIHAPLYYRLASLLGWLLHRAGFDTVVAALVAGRLLSSLGFLATIAAAYFLARQGGLPARAGGWAALLVAATPIYTGVPFEVRPDMLGIAFQTSGILFVLAAIATAPSHVAKLDTVARAWEGEPPYEPNRSPARTEPRPPRIALGHLSAAAICFAAAVCIKQQFVVAPLVSLSLIVEARFCGRLRAVPVLLFTATGLATALLYFGTEEWLAGGRMWASVFVAARNVGRVHPADWPFSANLLLATIWKCVGPILLLASSGLAMLEPRRGRFRSGSKAVGSLLIAAVVTLSAVQFFVARIGVSGLLAGGLIVIVAAIIPGCYVLAKSLRGDAMDRALWIYFAAELAFTTILWRLSTGGWFNYAIPAVVVGCVLTGRSLARAFEGNASQRAVWPAVIASLAVPVFAWTDVKQVSARREAESAEISRLLVSVPQPARELFFVDLPGANRMYGMRSLVYDPWLYPVFEAIGQAEPRSVWLEPALARGAVRYVATTSARGEIDGLKRTLPELGYTRLRRVRRYFLWVRLKSSVP